MVRDPNGNIRASLGKAGDKVGLDLLDAQGRRRATLELGADGAPGLAFYDQDQKIRAELNLGPDGEPKFILRDQRGLEIPKGAEITRRCRPAAAPGRDRSRRRGQARCRLPQPPRQKPLPPTRRLRLK